MHEAAWRRLLAANVPYEKLVAFKREQADYFEKLLMAGAGGLLRKVADGRSAAVRTIGGHKGTLTHLGRNASGNAGSHPVYLCRRAVRQGHGRVKCHDAPWMYDWPSRADERRRAFAPEIIDVEYRVVSTVRRRPAIGFMSCLLITGVAMAVLLRFFWPAVLMLFVFAGGTSPSEMIGAIGVLVIVAAAALRERSAGRRF